MTGSEDYAGRRSRNRAGPRAALRRALLLLFAATSALAHADLFSPNRPLGVLRTEWFDITFPGDARASAERLAAFADDAYREIAAFLGTEPRLRYPVVLTPDPGASNGYYTVWPSRRIVLYLAPADPNDELGYQREDLAAVFRHELAHAVSLSIRPPFLDVLAAVFGDPAGLSFYTTPANLAEGVAIAAEGLDGLGRARDPLTAEPSQDALEGRFKSFWESAGAWDGYPYGRVPYSYGALFTRYLLEEYGTEPYRELWRRMGRGLLVPGLGDFLFVRGAFRQVYGLPLARAWEGFHAWAAPPGPIEEPLRLSPPGLLSAVTASGPNLYWADGAARKIRSRAAVSGTREQSWPGDASVSRLSVSADGRRLLVSRLRYEGGLPRAALRELDLESGRSRDLPWRGLRDAAYAPDGLVAICSADPEGRAGSASLVLIRNGEEAVILAGSPSVSYASPTVSRDGRRIYALRREVGKVSVVRVELEAGGADPQPAEAAPSFPAAPASAYRVRRLTLPEDFLSIRYLSVDEEETLRFSWSDGSFYRLAELRGEVYRFQTATLSGGVQHPVYADGAVYYLGYFSEGAALCALPSDPSRPGWEESPAAWEPLDPDSVPAPGRPVGEGASLGSESRVEEAPPHESRPYSILPSLAPGFRYPSFRLSSEGLWSVGVGVASADPAQTFLFGAQARWVPALNAAEMNAVLELSSLRPVLRLQASDEFSSDGAAGTLRTTRAGLSAAWGAPLYGGRFYEAGAGAQALWFSSIPQGGDPYSPPEARLAAGTAFAAYGRRAFDIRRPAAMEGAWAEVTSFGAYVLPPGEPNFLLGVEAALRLRALPAALALDLYAAASLSPSLSYGPDGRAFEGFSSAAAYPSYAAFSGGEGDRLYAYADASVSPLVLEIRGRLGPLYLRRLKTGAGFRGAVSAGDLCYSLYSRCTLSFSPLVGIYARLRPEAWIEAEYVPAEGRGKVRCLVELPL